MNPVINHITSQLSEIRHGKLWMGGSFADKLDGVDERLVFTRPLPHLHSIAELISHLTFWRNEALLKIKTGTASKTDDCEENWLPNETLKAKGWSALIAEHDRSLSELIDLLQEKDDSFLYQTYYDPDYKSTYPYRFLIDGMLHHDLYHLGQLGLVIKYLKLKNTH